MKPVILIPAYQPDQQLIDLLDVLTRDPQQKIIVVNDGSTGPAKKIVEKLAAYMPQVDLLHHAVNLGKGQALKTGFNHFLLQYGRECAGVVTGDADGQHAPEDILRIAASLEENPQALCLGSRTIRSDAPLRSQFGNRVTILVFKLVTGVGLVDTQTGLRGIPSDFLRNLLRSRETGYDFELDMLIRATKRKMQIVETPIQTIYMDNNKSSHFNYIRDSFKIYFVFLRFSMISIATAIIDYLIFALVFSLSAQTLPSMVMGRIAGGTFQFTAGKLWVFKSQDKPLGELLKYVTLVISLMMLSYGLLTLLVTYLGLNPYLAKPISDGAIFLLSFAAQNILVYATRSNSDADEKGVP